MSRRRKYNYDIKIIEEMESKGHSLRSIARKNGWCQCNTISWVKRNYPIRRVTVRYFRNDDECI